MNKQKIELGLALIHIWLKNAHDSNSALSQKRLWSFHLLKDWIEMAVKLWYIRYISIPPESTKEEDNKYYLSDSGREFLERILDILDDPE